MTVALNCARVKTTLYCWPTCLSALPTATCCGYLFGWLPCLLNSTLRVCHLLSQEGTISDQSGVPLRAPIFFSFCISLAYILAPIAECQRTRECCG